jgi:hypothetical protein
VEEPAAATEAAVPVEEEEVETTAVVCELPAAADALMVLASLEPVEGQAVGAGALVEQAESEPVDVPFVTSAVPVISRPVGVDGRVSLPIGSPASPSKSKSRAVGSPGWSPFTAIASACSSSPVSPLRLTADSDMDHLFQCPPGIQAAFCAALGAAARSTSASDGAAIPFHGALKARPVNRSTEKPAATKRLLDAGNKKDAAILSVIVKMGRRSEENNSEPAAKRAKKGSEPVAKKGSVSAAKKDSEPATKRPKKGAAKKPEQAARATRSSVKSDARVTRGNRGTK